jgi:hypothetical protein
LGDPFASNLEPFSWLNLQISKGVDRGEREEKKGRCFMVRNCRGGEMIDEREGGGVKEDSFYCGPTG